jgi:hypothetical protein
MHTTSWMCVRMAWHGMLCKHAAPSSPVNENMYNAEAEIRTAHGWREHGMQSWPCPCASSSRNNASVNKSTSGGILIATRYQSRVTTLSIFLSCFTGFFMYKRPTKETRSFTRGYFRLMLTGSTLCRHKFVLVLHRNPTNPSGENRIKQTRKKTRLGILQR